MTIEQKTRTRCPSPLPQKGTRLSSPWLKPVFYTQITNGDEKRDERLQAGSEREASPSTGFSNREVRRLKKRKQVGPPVSHMHDRGFCQKPSQTADQTHPDIGFSLAALPTFASGFACRSGNTDKWLLHRTAQNLTSIGHERQDRLQVQSSPSPIADLAHTGRLGVLAQVHWPLVSCDLQHDWPRLNLFARLLPMRLYQRPRSVTSSSSSSLYKAIVSFQVCIWSGKDAEGFFAMPLAAWTALPVRRMSWSFSLDTIQARFFFSRLRGASGENMVWSHHST
jgi:hypothetical protein